MPSWRKAVAYAQLPWHIPGQEFDVTLEVGSAGGTSGGPPGLQLPGEARCEIRDWPPRCSASSGQGYVRAC